MIKTLMTADEFMNTGPETDHCELVRGEIVRKPPPSNQHGLVAANLAFLFGGYVRSLGRGKVWSNDTAIQTRRDPDSVRGMDVGVVIRDLPESERHLKRIVSPLIAEVRSPSQSWRAILEKTGEYIGKGVPLVWIVDPQTFRVAVFRLEHEPQTFAAENELDGGDVLPGFRCQVEEIFRGVEPEE